MVTAAELQSVGDKLAQGCQECQRDLDLIPAAVRGFLGSPQARLLPDGVKQWVVNAANKFMELCDAFLKKMEDFLQGLVMPVSLLERVFGWTEVQRKSALISDTIDVHMNMDMTASHYWKGPAATAYFEAVKAHAGKARRISDLSYQVIMAVGMVGAAALAFYVALGIIVVKFLNACVLVIAELHLGSIFTVTGLVLAVEEAAINTGLILGLVATLSAALATATSWAATIKGEVGATFPSGRWPKGGTEHFSDASMRQDAVGPKDGSQWRLQP